MSKVLVIATNEASREPAYITSKVLAENGHAASICNADEESDIHSDVVLSKNTSLDGYEGLIFIDDGGDQEASLALAKKADCDMAIGSLSAAGSLILASAGVFKDHHVCAGLPEEAYKGANQIDSPSVRSDKLVTGMGDCANGFTFLFVDALGGKIKRIVESDEDADALVVADAESQEFSDKVVEAIRALKDKPEAAHAQDLFRRGSAHRSGDKVVFGRGDIALASKDGKEYEIFNDAEKLATFADMPAGRSVSLTVRRGEDGWGFSSDDVWGPEAELLSELFISGRSISAAAKINAIHAAALDAAIVAQAMSDDPDDLSGAKVTMVVDDSGIDVKSVSAIPCESHGDKDNDRHYYLERDLGAEGLFLQPDGKVAIKLPSGTKKLDAEDALEFLAKKISEASSREIDDIERDGGPDPWNERASRRHRHVLRCLIGLLSDTGAISWPVSEVVRTAAISKFADKGYTVGGANFGLSTDNLDITTRVYPYKEEEDYLNDKDHFVKNLGRYNPEYINTANPTTWGVYYVWDEQRRDPYSWYRRFTDGVYPFNEALKP